MFFRTKMCVCRLCFSFSLYVISHHKNFCWKSDPVLPLKAASTWQFVGRRSLTYEARWWFLDFGDRESWELLKTAKFSPTPTQEVQLSRPPGDSIASEWGRSLRNTGKYKQKISALAPCWPWGGQERSGGKEVKAGSIGISVGSWGREEIGH